MRNLLSAKKADAAEVMSKDVSALPVNVDSTVHTRLGWIIVLVGVCGSLLWALFAPLDKGVPVSGSVTVSSNRKAIQHLTGGIVEDILVKEGETVKAGQPLVKMNDVQARASVDMTRGQYFTARAAEARLTAERDSLGGINFPAELAKNMTDPRVSAVVNLQRQLFSARQSALKNELGAAEESVAGSESQLRGLSESLESQKQQQKFLKEQLDGIRELAKDGYVARNRLLDVERTYAQVNGSISETIGNVGRTQRQIAELGLRINQRKQEYQKEVRTQLSDTQKEAEALEARLKALDFDMANVIVRAPVDGTVVGMNIFTRGGVIGQGFRMMDIVPSDDPLVVEGMVPVNLIDKVHSGLKVELIFSAFNQNQTPHIPGIVTQVSADRMTDERTGQPYYKLKAQVAPEGVKLIAHLAVRPGMPVEIFVKTGERTMMNYLLKPVFDRAKTSMTEE